MGFKMLMIVQKNIQSGVGSVEEVLSVELRRRRRRSRRSSRVDRIGSKLVVGVDLNDGNSM